MHLFFAFFATLVPILTLKVEMKHLPKLFLILVLLQATEGWSQTILKREGLMKMDQGADAMMDGKYREADQLFREALGLLDRLPSELAYYFGRNSYHLQKNKQAINWLNKYIELKGTSGQYYDKASTYLKLASAAFRKEQQKEQEITEQQLSNNGYYECPSDIVACPVCQGSGVLITPGKFGAVYQTCPVSGLSGRMTCDQYNQYLRGELAAELK
jgi:tetratricopeptide (TPR) repeat protein